MTDDVDAPDWRSLDSDFNSIEIQSLDRFLSLKKPCCPHGLGRALMHSCVSCRFDMHMTSWALRGMTWMTGKRVGNLRLFKFVDRLGWTTLRVRSWIRLFNGFLKCEEAVLVWCLRCRVVNCAMFKLLVHGLFSNLTMLNASSDPASSSRRQLVRSLAFSCRDADKP